MPAFAVALGRALRAAGVPTGPERSLRFTRALELTRPGDREAVYWTARVVFLSSHEHIETFDRLFAALFDRHEDPAAWRGERRPDPRERRAQQPRQPDRGMAEGGGESRVATLASSAREGSGDEEREARLAAASDEERLREKSFAELSAAELAQLRRLMSRLALAPPERRTRRSRRGRHGERLDVHATIRRSRRTGGDAVRWEHRRRRRRRRRLVMLLDISGSMEPHARAFLQFLESGVGGASAEAFVFATRLTRLTRALRGRNPQAAIERAATTAPDWSGGTRIGAALKTFNDRYGRRGLARGAVVVIVSDGWERRDPADVGREMERLRRLAHRIVWVNPRAGAAGFAPLAGGMAAALPHVDALVGGDRLSDLDEVVEAIAAS